MFAEGFLMGLGDGLVKKEAENARGIEY